MAPPPSEPTESSEWRPPEAFEEYRLVRELGRGAMGHVYLAHDTLLDRPVAVKFIATDDPDADTRERFYIEARAVARLQHPNVVAVYRVGEVRRRPYLVSEYLRGESLDRLGKPVPWRRALEIGVQLARGLAAAHRRGVLHRDIKPANAMLTEDGGVKLLDFGLAKLLDALGPLAAATAELRPSRSAPGAKPDEPVAPGAPARTMSLPVPVAARTASLPSFAEAGSQSPERNAPALAQIGPAATLGPTQPASAAPSTSHGHVEVARAVPAPSPLGASTLGLPQTGHLANGASGLTESAGLRSPIPGANGTPQPLAAPSIDPTASASSSDSGVSRAGAAQTFLRAELASAPIVPADQVPEFGSAETHTPRPAASLGSDPSATIDLPGGAPAAAARAATFDHATASPTSSPSSDRARLTEVGAVLGSPLYMAPEAWRSEPATSRTDVYSLGVLLYELCAGDPPWSGLPIPSIAVNAMTKEAPALRSVAPEVDPAFAAVVDRCLRSDPNDRFDSGESLREALESLTAPVRSLQAIPEGNPYRGLMAFEAEHRSLFFGRGAEIRAILDRLRSEPWVAIAGDSGVGKSSLARAGVLPAVADAALGGEAPAIVTLVPGRHPLASLAAVLAPILGTDEAETAATLKAEPEQLGRALRKKRTGAGLFVFVDQLEELVTLSDPEEARIAAEALASLAMPGSGIRLLTTARSDFLGRLAALPALGDGLARVLYLLKPLGPEGVRDAVVAPARAMGFAFETEAMIDSLVSAATRTDGSLPLLQFALSELWTSRDEGKRLIPSSALERMGGVAGALAKHADRVLEGLVGSSRPAARRILLKLVTAEGTRARRSEAELVGGDAGARAALEALVHGRLIVARDTEEGEGSYEIAHEALISSWDTLREWLSTNLETRAARQRLEAAASEWERLGRSRESLWSRRQLEEVRTLHDEDLGSREQAFLTATRRDLRISRMRRIAGVIAVPLVLGSIAGAIELRSRVSLRQQLGERISSAKVSSAEAARTNDRALQLATQAFALFDRADPKAEDLWAESRQAAEDAETLLAQATRSLELGLSLRPADPEVTRALAEVTLERFLLAERRRQYQHASELAARLELLDPQGEVRGRLVQPALLTLDSVPSGAEVSVEYVTEEEDRLVAQAPVPLGTTPLRDVPLTGRSAILLIRRDGHAPVRYPIYADRGESLALAPRLLPASDLPPDMIFIPAGRYLAGSDEDEDLRRAYLDAPPMHRRATGDYLIARHEVTYGQWIEFLDSLPPSERAVRTPSVTRSRRSVALELHREEERWALSLELPAITYTAREGEPITYQGRTTRASQDWRRFPVSAVSFSDAESFAAWLASTGRVPRARLCTEDEWERAARGADGRPYPCTRSLSPQDANFDLAYGRVAQAYGPDVVGSREAICPSPVGAADMSGNVWEWLRSRTQPAQAIFRGGSFYERSLSSRISNRNIGDANVRDPFLGVRICADPPWGGG